MSYLSKSILEIHEALLSGKVTPLELVQESLELAKKDTNNAFEYICEKEALEAVKKLDSLDKNNPLWGIPYVLKDNFSTKDIPTCGSSNILNGYTPIFSSEVYNRLTSAGAILIGKTTLDELAMGGSGKTGHKGYTFNPWDPSHKHIMGGSSCGSAACMCAGIVPFAIGSDTGDSVRKPASHGGLVGMKATWGRISRFGLFPFAPSLDHVAFFTRNVKDSEIVLNALAGRDEKDATSSEKPVENYTKTMQNSNGIKRLAYIKGIFDSISNECIRSKFLNLVDELKNQGHVVDIVDIPLNLLKAIFPTYIVISCSEATSNNANLDGIKFGQRIEGEDYEHVMINTRTAGFSSLIKRRFIIGSYSLLKENQKDIFVRAQKCRRLIVNAVNDILKTYDGIILPAAPSAAPLFDDTLVDSLSNEYLIADNYLAIGNFGGFPSITLPLGFENGLPFGVNITSKAFNEVNMYELAEIVENLTNLKDLVAKGDK